MSIRTKLFIQTTIILLIVLFFGGYTYLSSLDQVFANKTKLDVSHDVQKIHNHIENIKRDLEKSVEEIAADESIRASLNLISNYEDKKTYQAIVFDAEKKQLLEYLKPRVDTQGASIEVYDKSGMLVAQLGKEDSGYVTWKEGRAYFVSLDGEIAAKNSEFYTQAVDKSGYDFRASTQIESLGKDVGYIVLVHHFGKNDLQYLAKNFINDIYLQYADKTVALADIEGIDRNSYEVVKTKAYEGNEPLYAISLVDKSFVKEQKNSVIVQLLITGGVLILISFAISWYISKHLVVDRLIELRDAILSLKQSNYRKIPNKYDDEIGVIIDDFNDIFAEFAKEYAQLKSYRESVDRANIVSATDKYGRIEHANEEFLRISEYSFDEVRGKSHNIIRHPDMPASVFKDLWDTIKAGKVWTGEIKNLKKGGGYYWADSVVSPVFNNEGEIDGYVSVRRDITELKEKTEKLQKIADFDEMTGLKSRSKLQSDIVEFGDVAAAVINIDRFSQINDFYGHRFGDTVLVEFAKNLKKLAEITYTDNVSLYRPNSDEFVIVDPLAKDGFIEETAKLLERLEDKSIQGGDKEVDLNVSCGISYEQSDKVLLTADMALKVCKKQKRPFVVYTDEIDLNAVYESNIKWTKKLKNAIAQDRIVPYFQPIVGISKEEKKYECLVRMIDDDAKVISPFFFLDVAKQTKQYPAITKIMLQKSFETFADKECDFSLNLTAEDMISPQIRGHIMQMLQEYAALAHRVVFEIVESESIESYQEVLDFIDSVKAKGCKIAIDDFGTGYSNFEYLLKLKADFIKIDGSLIKNIATSRESEVVVSVIVNFAKQMHIQTVAEFVEDETILHKLKELGVDYAQGYHFSPPLERV
ncbi:MAG: EAL domain-containing protein [Campylobacterota bacterium]